MILLNARLLQTDAWQLYEVFQGTFQDQVQVDTEQIFLFFSYCLWISLVGKSLQEGLCRVDIACEHLIDSCSFRKDICCFLRAYRLRRSWWDPLGGSWLFGTPNSTFGYYIEVVIALRRNRLMVAGQTLNNGLHNSSEDFKCLCLSYFLFILIPLFFGEFSCLVILHPFD